MPLTEYDIECAEAVKKIIDADISTHYSIGTLAAKAGIGESRLKILFKLVFKTGLYSYLRKQRMERAREMVVNKQKNLETISRASGFKHYTNFSKSFKKSFGMTPGKYRKNIYR